MRCRAENTQERRPATLSTQISILMAVLIFGRAGLVRVVRPVSDFYVAGRLMPAMFNGMAIAASLMAALVFVGIAGGVGPRWEGAGALLLGGGLGLVLSGLLLAPYLRAFGGYTLPDFLAERFGGDKIRPLAVLAVILCSFPPLAAVLLALGLVGAVVFALPVAVGAGAGVVLILVGTLIGGMRSLSLSQIAQYGLLLAVSLVAVAVTLWQTGTLSSVESVLLDEAIPGLGLEAFVARDGANRLALMFCVAAGTASMPYLLMRSFTTPSPAEARASYLAAPVFAGVLCLAAPAFAALFEPAWVGGGDVLSMIAEALLVLGALTGLLAIGGGLALALGNVLSEDLYFKSLRPTASTQRRIRVARLSLILVTGLAALAAVVAPEETLTATAAAFSLAASAFLPVLVLGVWWRRASSDAALAGMVAGLVVCLYYMIGPHTIPFAFYESSSFVSNATDAQAAAYEALRHDYYLADAGAKEAILAAWDEAARPIANWWGVRGVFAGLFAVPAGFVVMIVVSLFTQAPSADVQRLVKGLRVRAA
jgi:cation/acetate symporter